MTMRSTLRLQPARQKPVLRLVPGMLPGLILGLAAGLLLPAAASARDASTPDTPAADTRHHLQNKFTNPFTEPHSGGFWGIFHARFLSGEWQTYKAERDIVSTTQPRVLQPGTASDNATVTWLGHSTVLIQHQGVNVLTDPMFSKYASPVSFAGPKRITAAAVAPADLPPIDVVVISHDHYDHLDTASVKALGDAPLYFVPLGLRQWFERKGVNPDRVVELDWWSQQDLEFRGTPLRITATPSQHFSGRSLTDRNKTLWAAWAIQWADFRVWFGGDTGYNSVQFQQIGQYLGPFDLGIIPIGAYKPRDFMRVVHVNPEEAVLIHRDIRARRSMGVHWGTFILSGEGVLAPARDLAAARLKYELDEQAFNVYAVGETRSYPPAPPAVNGMAARVPDKTAVSVRK